MKKRFYCPSCGTRETSNLFITTHKGTNLSLHLSSQANIRKSTGEVCCIVCRHVGKVKDFEADKE